ncbi:hypothetical protein A2Z00_05560 [Candidatus Gottesmanbacteria bacterium RBG_13_45_10]|uniref:ATP synthase gamma chain n=1 Tax=Candidatus Gottesmanbacteria bacterium RBG_13_45_10 TaxID=1798370 RepID=A0A1F5ZH25_9BACT|nr:MAG: hypothetical protein A2Z00_05560 [Candidatus Gottesmanbacteria bacterium RBG_13_45_10]
MPTVSDLKVQLEDAITLSLISSAFTEASASGLQKIKGKFETNRQFYDEISHVYHLVRVSADRLRLDEKKKPIEPKMLSVAMTSNQRFYGNLNINIMHGFLEETAKVKTDIMVVGLTGIEYMRSQTYPHPYEKMQFEKDNPNIDEVRVFLEKTTPYDQVLVYFPKFVSLINQIVGVIDITQAINPKDQPLEEEIHILFEPEYDKILEFFRQQVRHLLIMHVLLEASLSRTSARLLTMSAAEERSAALIKQTKMQLRKIQLSISNARLLETFAGMGKWKNKRK